MAQEAVIHKIIPFSCVDGPGNRTAVFFQGCNLDCLYCHNPETIGECIHCGICVEQCPAGALKKKDEKILYHKERCVSCDGCIHICPHKASPKTFLMTVEDVMTEIKKQVPFIRGITVSGGECSRYPAFLQELFKGCQNIGLTTLMDSNGTLDFSQFPELLEVTDGVMLDIKAYSSKDYCRITGNDGRLILQNAVYLAEMGKLEEIRTVVVPELFEAEEVVAGIGRLLLPYKESVRYKLITFRPFGVREAYRGMAQPTQSFMEKLRESLIKQGWQKENIWIV